MFMNEINGFETYLACFQNQCCLIEQNHMQMNVYKWMKQFEYGYMEYILRAVKKATLCKFRDNKKIFLWN